jgi:hypothetical protein
MAKAMMTIVLSSAVVIALSSASALADEVLFRSHILGSNPDLVIGGVTSGRAPWKVTEGSASLDDEGSLRVKVEGLVRVALGTPGPVTQVSASLVCGGTGGAVVATTGAVSLSAEGDAKIEAKINLPSSCFGPVLLVRIAGLNGTLLPAPDVWIAASGLQSASPDQDEGDRDHN